MSEFITLEQANAYFQDERPDATEWNAADDATRQRYLNCSENIILAAFRFPANFLDAEDQTGRNHRRFRNAICEESLHLMQTGALRKNPKLMMGIEEAGAGPLSVTFSKDFDKPLFPELVELLIEGAGAIVSGTNSITSGAILF